MFKSNPLISIIIPTWNRAESLRVALESCLAQTYRNIEIIVCDDFSTDDSFDVIQSFDQSKIKYTKLSRFGSASRPRNEGIKMSRGEWLAFLDSDDTWYPEKLCKQLEIADTYSAQMVCSNAHVNSKTLYFAKENSTSRYLTQKELLEDNKVICSSVLIHRNALPDRKEIFNEKKTFRVGEDYLLWLEVSRKNKIYYFNEPLINYARSIDSISFGAKKFYKTKLLILHKLLCNKKLSFVAIPTFAKLYLKNLAKCLMFFFGDK